VYHDSAQIAARARRGLDAKFEREALRLHPELTGEALAKKVALIRRLHMTRLACLSVKARQKKTHRPHGASDLRENAAR